MRLLLHYPVGAFDFYSFLSIVQFPISSRSSTDPRNLPTAVQQPAFWKRSEIGTDHFKPPARAKTKAKQAPTSHCWQQSRAHAAAQKRFGKERGSSATLRTQQHHPSPPPTAAGFASPPCRSKAACQLVPLILICQQELSGRNADKPNCQQLQGLWLLEIGF